MENDDATSTIVKKTQTSEKGGERTKRPHQNHAAVVVLVHATTNLPCPNRFRGQSQGRDYFPNLPNLLCCLGTRHTKHFKNLQTKSSTQSGRRSQHKLY